MLNIVYSRAFLKDYKRELKGQYSATIEHDVKAVAALLVHIDETPLPLKYKDHVILAEWKDHRECHLKHDLLLIYCVEGDELRLVRVGSHTRLFKKL